MKVSPQPYDQANYRPPWKRINDFLDPMFTIPLNVLGLSFGVGVGSLI